MRKPLQGVANIVRFNWHYYVLAVGFLWMLIAFGNYVGGMTRILLLFLCLPAFVSILVSLAVSFYVYDLSNLYSLEWLGKKRFEKGSRLVNINAGFDETTELLHLRFPKAEIAVLDFYDPAKHTEISIKRARKAYPPFAGTIQIKTSAMSLETDSAEAIFVILAAHEIRKPEERAEFFRELERILAPGGQIFVTEHLRDLPNVLAYTFGAFHFHSRRSWIKAFEAARLKIAGEIMITPFITTFILESNGTAT